MTPVEPRFAHRSCAQPERTSPFHVAELTDPDGDGLALSTRTGDVWFTCTTEGEEVTVGPFPASALRAALTMVGNVSRTGLMRE